MTFVAKNYLRVRRGVPAAWLSLALLGLLLVPVAGQETKHDGRLVEYLRSLSAGQLKSIVRSGEWPDELRAMQPSAQELEAGLLLELARRIEPDASEEEPKLGTSEILPSLQVGQVANPAAEETAATVVAEKIEFTAARAADYGVGKIELQFAEGHGPQMYPDLPVQIQTQGGSIRYRATEVSYDQVGKKVSREAKRICLFFIWYGEIPQAVSISGIPNLDILPIELASAVDDTQVDALTRQWWHQFTNIPDYYSEDQRELKQSLLYTLARRMNLAIPVRQESSNKKIPAITRLEKQFERGIGMLFGIESVRLAMMEDTTLSDSSKSEVANIAMPAMPRLTSVAFETPRTPVWIEPIAMHVPQECFYLRTGSFANYRFFKQFLLGWGGELEDIVATKTRDSDLRKKIEGQLALSSNEIDPVALDQLISDLAIIGLDPMFEEGAAVGILLEARDSEKLAEFIHVQRQQVAGDDASLKEEMVGRGISAMVSDDNRVRSYYVVDGDYHLVTNSKRLAQRFVESGGGERSLGALNEYRYARSKTEKNDQTLAFFYLSDPFFQNLISPSFRVELTRRRRSVRELNQLNFAMKLAVADQSSATTLPMLIDNQYLPTGFGKRHDGSFPIITPRGLAVDSLRGSLGYFTPIADIQTSSVTNSELQSYRQFVAEYNRQWNRVDPVSVTFSYHGDDIDGNQQIGVDIMVTPYAQQHYQTLRSHLARPTTERISHFKGDLLSLDTFVQNYERGPSHLLYLGLRDTAIPFEIKDGDVHVLGKSSIDNFGRTRSYAVVSPPNDRILELLGSVLDRVNGTAASQLRENNKANTPGSQNAIRDILPLNPSIYVIGTAAELAVKWGRAMVYSNYVSTVDMWTAASADSELRNEALQAVSTETDRSLPQVRMRLTSLGQSQIEPYIQAQTYLSARRISAEQALFLQDFTDWLDLTPESSLDALEGLQGSSLRCPLGGEYQSRTNQNGSAWVSSAWPEPSRFSETGVPANWRFGFLDWLQGMDLRFSMDASTLRASAVLAVRQPQSDHVKLDVSPLQMDSENDWDSVGINRQARADGEEVAQNVAAIPSTDLGREVRRNSGSINKIVLGVDIDRSSLPLRVTGIHKNSIAKSIGMTVDDLILSIDGQDPRSFEHLVELLHAARRKKGATIIRLMRDEVQLEYSVRLDRRND